MLHKTDLIEQEIPAFLQDQQSVPELPVMLTARFEMLSNRASLQIAVKAAPGLFIQIIHEGRAGIESELLYGSQASRVILVHDAESILILARYEGAIVAGVMAEVSMNLAESIDRLLRPVVDSNIIVEQHNLGRLGISLRDVPDPDETQLVAAVKIGGVR